MRAGHPPDPEAIFGACDTTWRVVAHGPDAERAVARAEATVRALGSRLNAFDPSSAVSHLNRTGRVDDPHVTRIVVRAAEYSRRTGGAFDITRGELERAVKEHIRGHSAVLAPPASRAIYEVRGTTVATKGRLDLNGLAKGYIVDAARRVLDDHGVSGFVDGGGDLSPPTGPVAIEAPDGRGRLGVLDTRWNVATSSPNRRRRGDTAHLYDPRTGVVGAAHEQVTVVARRDCMEADALATTLCILPLREGMRLVDAWPDVEALWVAGGDLYASGGFDDHVW